MHLLVIGAAGMIGRKLAQKVAATGQIGGAAVSRVTLADVIAPAAPASGPPCTSVTVDLSQPGAAARLVADAPDVIVHLAAVVSGEAEVDMDKGYRVNLDGTRALFEALRHATGPVPRVIFASSLAVFGAPFPDRIPDDFALAPLTSYGVQKAMGELLLGDYSRRGFLDGVGLRLPTICIRPGAPNRAASSFFSGILREPLNGQDAVLPVDETTRHWFASPRAAVGFIEHAATMDTALLGDRRSLTMPGLSASVAEQISALRDVAGDAAVARIHRLPDPAVAQIVAGWPRGFDTQRATQAGFRAETSFRQIIDIYLQDEMGA